MKGEVPVTIKVKECLLPETNRFAEDYVQSEGAALQFFPYHPFRQESFEERLAELRGRSIQREKLAQVIEEFMEPFSPTPRQREELKHLRDETSVVVIGGQQAGLLTGPMYTLYKIVTILQVARQQKERLGVPVVPVFWIAGEDHDFQEINHVYLPAKEEGRMEKIVLSFPEEVRRPISRRNLPLDELNTWLEEVFLHLKETDFSPELRTVITQAAQRSETYVDFFAFLIQHYFGEEGLLFIDSAYPALRELEAEHFVQIIEGYDEIDAKIRDAWAKMKEAGYPPQVNLGPHPALLFVEKEGERLLLEKRDSFFVTKDLRFRYTKEELVHLARTQPWSLSNNVLTRPYMQEILFPTLSFVAGPGEVAYWALLGPYFEAMGLTMPIVIPRLRLTLLEPHIAHYLDKHALDVETVVTSFEEFQREWLAKQDRFNLEDLFTGLKEEIKNLYQPVIETVGQINKGLFDLGHKNLNKVLEQVDYLHKRATADHKKQHEAALRQFAKIKQAVYPEEKLQERVYNPFYFFNKYGTQWLSVLIEEPFDYNGKHHLVYLS